jgi:hypothetical protein
LENALYVFHGPPEWYWTWTRDGGGKPIFMSLATGDEAINGIPWLRLVKTFCCSWVCFAKILLFLSLQPIGEKQKT